MKKRDLLNRLARIANARGAELELHRHGSEHDIYRIADTQLSIPRHSEVSEQTAKRILRKAEGTKP